MTKKSNFDIGEDNKLIEAVRHYPALCSKEATDFKCMKTNERRQLWNAIADQVGRTPDECKLRWRNIKDYYVKKKKRGGSDSRLLFLDNYVNNYSPHCSVELGSDDDQDVPNGFDEPYIETPGKQSEPEIKVVECQLESDLQHEDEKQDIEESPEYEPHFKRSKLEVIDHEILSSLEARRQRLDLFKQKMDKRKTSSADDLSMFFASIESTVKRLPEEVLPELKRQIFSIVSDFEIKYGHLSNLNQF